MSHFENELAALKERLLLMASRAEAAVNNAIKALVERDDDLARRVMEEDDAIDQLEQQVDAACIALLSKAPLATQLRLINPSSRPMWTSPAWPRWRWPC